MKKLLLNSLLLCISIVSFSQSDLDSLFDETQKGSQHLVELDLGAIASHGIGLHLQYGTLLTDRLKFVGGLGIYKPHLFTFGVYSPSSWGPTVTLGVRRYGKVYDPLHYSMSFISGFKYRFTYNTTSSSEMTGATRSITNSFTPYIGWGLFYPKLEICVTFGIGFGMSNINFDNDLVDPSIYNSNQYPKKGISFEAGPKIGYKF